MSEENVKETRRILVVLEQDKSIASLERDDFELNITSLMAIVEDAIVALGYDPETLNDYILDWAEDIKEQRKNDVDIQH